MFQKIPVELPKPPIYDEKHQSLLHATGGGWYMNNFNDKLPPLNKSNPRKKTQEKENEIKIKLQTASQNWNDWRFQIHWNKLEWVKPRNRIEQKIHILCILKSYI